MTAACAASVTCSVVAETKRSFDPQIISAIELNGSRLMLAEAATVFLSAILVWSRRLWPLQVVALAVTYGAAIMFGIVRPAGIVALAAILLLAWLCSAIPDGLKGATVHGVFFVVAVLLSLRLLPGFQNPLLLGPVRFTPDAVPFKMYLNLDKASVGFALMLFYSPLVREMGIARTLLGAAAGAILGLPLTLPPALLLGAIRWEPKYPEALQLWALDNFLLVAGRGGAVSRVPAGQPVALARRRRGIDGDSDQCFRPFVWRAALWLRFDHDLAGDAGRPGLRACISIWRPAGVDAGAFRTEPLSYTAVHLSLAREPLRDKAGW
jgi:hypothetical protein